MTVDGSDSDSLALPSAEDAYVLVIEAFNSSNRARKDPRKLPGFKYLSTNIRVITVRTCHDHSLRCVLSNTQTSRPNTMKSFPDFQTFTVNDALFHIENSLETLSRFSMSPRKYPAPEEPRMRSSRFMQVSK